MKKMFKIKNFTPKNVYSRLYMNSDDIKNILKHGHKIGLHSHSHPTLLENLSFNEQFNEYKKNTDS